MNQVSWAQAAGCGGAWGGLPRLVALGSCLVVLLISTLTSLWLSTHFMKEWGNKRPLTQSPQAPLGTVHAVPSVSPA